MVPRVEDLIRPLVAGWAATRSALRVHDLLQGPGCPTWAGLLLMDAAGGDPQVFLQESPDAFGPCYLMWDLAQGRLVPVQRDASPFFSCLPPALGYQWKANGALASAIPLAGQGTPPAPSCDPAGDPDGAASFTIWQGGSVDLVSRSGSSTFHQPGAFTWNSGFTAWSPDGRYLTTQINVQGRLKPAGQPEPAQDALVDLGLDQAPVLPVPDLAILPVTGALAAAASPASDYQSTHMEWRPDGRVLAAIGPAGDRSSPPSAAPRRVELYDCATGRKLTTLVPLIDVRHIALFYSRTILRWSPDGRHLLLISGPLGTCTIWGPDQLGMAAG